MELTLKKKRYIFLVNLKGVVNPKKSVGSIFELNAMDIKWMKNG